MLRVTIKLNNRTRPKAGIWRKAIPTSGVKAVSELGNQYRRTHGDFGGFFFRDGLVSLAKGQRMCCLPYLSDVWGIGITTRCFQLPFCRKVVLSDQLNPLCWGKFNGECP